MVIHVEITEYDDFYQELYHLMTFTQHKYLSNRNVILAELHELSERLPHLSVRHLMILFWNESGMIVHSGTQVY